jgi:hypothetical protein
MLKIEINESDDSRVIALLNYMNEWAENIKAVEDHADYFIVIGNRRYKNPKFVSKKQDMFGLTITVQCDEWVDIFDKKKE